MDRDRHSSHTNICGEWSVSTYRESLEQLSHLILAATRSGLVLTIISRAPLVGLEQVQLPDCPRDPGLAGLVPLPLARCHADDLGSLLLGMPRIDAGLGDHVVSIVAHAASGAVQ